MYVSLDMYETEALLLLGPVVAQASLESRQLLLHDADVRRIGHRTTDEALVTPVPSRERYALQLRRRHQLWRRHLQLKSAQTPRPLS